MKAKRIQFTKRELELIALMCDIALAGEIGEGDYGIEEDGGPWRISDNKVLERLYDKASTLAERKAVTA